VLPPKPYFSAPFTATTHPFSVLNNPLVHIRHKMLAVREQVRRWVQHVSIQMVNSAWAGDVRWVCSRAGWTGTPPYPPPPGSQAACVVPLLQTLMAARTHATPHHCTAFTARRRDTLECTCSEGETVGVCAGNKPVSSPRIGWWASPPVRHRLCLRRGVHEARGHEGTLCTLLPLAAPSGLCCTDVPSSPTGRPDQLAACTGACASGWMYTMPQGAQLSAAVVWFVRGGCAQHQVCTSTVTCDAGLVMRTRPPPSSCCHPAVRRCTAPRVEGHLA
jgi:hypothetical protein